MESNQFTDIIKKIAKEKRTGSLLCVDKDNKLGRIYFNEGRAITARYDQTQGRDAYSSIIQLNPKSTRFHPDRDMVFSKLAIRNDAQAANATSVTDANPARDQTIDSPAAEISGSTNTSALTPELRGLLRDELAEFLGPVAQLVVDSLDDKISMKDAVAVLATEIGDRNAATKFINAMKQRTYF